MVPASLPSEAPVRGQVCGRSHHGGGGAGQAAAQPDVGGRPSDTNSPRRSAGGSHEGEIRVSWSTVPSLGPAHRFQLRPETLHRDTVAVLQILNLRGSKVFRGIIMELVCISRCQMSFFVVVVFWEKASQAAVPRVATRNNSDQGQHERDHI